MLILLDESLDRFWMEENIACTIKVIAWIRIRVDSNVPFIYQQLQSISYTFYPINAEKMLLQFFFRVPLE